MPYVPGAEGTSLCRALFLASKWGSALLCFQTLDSIRLFSKGRKCQRPDAAACTGPRCPGHSSPALMTVTEFLVCATAGGHQEGLGASQLLTLTLSQAALLPGTL